MSMMLVCRCACDEVVRATNDSETEQRYNAVLLWCFRHVISCVPQTQWNSTYPHGPPGPPCPPN